jgi:preprotein translocase subunit SecE
MDFTWLARWCTYLASWDSQLRVATESDAVETVEALTAQIQAFTTTFVLVFPYSMAGLVLLFGLWFGYRLVHWIMFADFLISVEGEMAKVSWPGKEELRSSTIVVLIVFFMLAGVLYIYDMFFVLLFKIIGVV